MIIILIRITIRFLVYLTLLQNLSQEKAAGTCRITVIDLLK